MSVPLYDYRRWPNFTKSELACTHTKLENPNKVAFTHLMDFVQEIRTDFGVPFKVTSAYRHCTHPAEAKKTVSGQHSIAAIDIQVPIAIAHEVVRKAFEAGCTGIGLKLHGDHRKRFIHLDFREGPAKIWSYK